MLVDLNLRGGQAVVVGGGTEAARKVEALLTQNCAVCVVAEKVCAAVARRARAGAIALRRLRVADAGFLAEFDRLILVVAATDDRALNRLLTAGARARGCYAYAVDDPASSDFSHPATINLYDTVQIAISTGGRSPLMARKIREAAEPLFKKLIKKKDVLEIELQSRLRAAAQRRLSSPQARKRFLNDIHGDPEIKRALARGGLAKAETLALEKLKRKR